MSKPEKPLLDDMKEEVRSLAGDVTEMAQLRWQLAQTTECKEQRSKQTRAYNKKRRCIQLQYSTVCHCRFQTLKTTQSNRTVRSEVGRQSEIDRRPAT